MRRQERRIIFARMMSFIRHAPLTFQVFYVDKQFVETAAELHDALLQQMLSFIVTHAADFNAYACIKVYYDNGQAEVANLLKEAFSLFSSRLEFVPSVTPSKYRLFQAADMIAALELLRIKLEVEHHISETEKSFFLTIQNLRKNYLKPLARKRWM